MLRRLKVGLTVAKRVLRPSSLYSAHSSSGSCSTDRDSIRSDPTHLVNTDDNDIYSLVEFGPAPYELAMPSRDASAIYDTVEYCGAYDIYEEYGFDDLYEPLEYVNTEVYIYTVCVCLCVYTLRP